MPIALGVDALVEDVPAPFPRDTSSAVLATAIDLLTAHFRISVEENICPYCSRLTASTRFSAASSGENESRRKGTVVARGPMQIVDEVFQLGGPQLTAPQDPAICLISFDGHAALIDVGRRCANETLLRSIEAVIELDDDVLCDGHYGIYRGRQDIAHLASSFIRQSWVWS